MANPDTLWGVFKLEDPILKGHENLSPANFETVLLGVGGDTAIVMDFVTYRGKVVAATPATHRLVALAAYVNADTQATNVPQFWCGQIIRPTRIPDPVAGVDWNPDTALTDTQEVVILKKGSSGVVTMCHILDQSLDILTGYIMFVSATAGKLDILTNTYTNTTPTGPENAVNILEGVHYRVGMADSVVEDNANENVMCPVSWL